MNFNIHAGHNPDGKIACGASGYIKESTEARKVKNEVIAELKRRGHNAYDCTCDNGTGQTDVLRKICGKANQRKVDLDVSIHFNSSNGQGNGTEVLYKTSNGSKWATKVQKSIVKGCGFKDRGIKKRDNLYYLNNTKNVAILIEVCFVDNKNDVNKYNSKKVAKAIVDGLVGEEKGSVKMDKVIAYVGDIDKVAATILNWKLKDYKLVEANTIKGKSITNLVVVGGGAEKVFPSAKVKLVGKDRFDTVKKVLDYVVESTH